MEKTYTFSDLIEIIAALRGENGCPWDRVQTHESLRSCMIEEAYEVVDAIRLWKAGEGADNLCEELGDVLLQVVLHSQIAAEEQLFTLDDVIQGISAKMIRRHPHVFGDGQAKTADQVPLTWEEIKKQEKGEGKTSELDQVPHSFPALIRSTKVMKKLIRQTEDFVDDRKSLSRAEALLGQLKEASSEEEAHLLGMLLLELCRFSALRGLNAEQSLQDCLETVIEEQEEG